MAIATADKNFGRQTILAVVQDLDYADLVASSAEALIDVRAGTRVLGGRLIINTAWDGTTPTLDLGDGGDPDRYTATPLALDATAGTVYELDVSAYKYTATDTIDGTLAVTGTPTQGAATLVVYYVIDGRANEVEPNYD